MKVYDLGQPYFAGMPHHPVHPPFLFGLVKQHGEYVGPGGPARMRDMLSAIPTRGRVILLVVLVALLAAPAALDRYFISVLILIFYFAFVGQADKYPTIWIKNQNYFL